MSTRKSYHGNARFIELGSPGAPFRSLVNVDKMSNLRFEQDIREGDVFAGWKVMFTLDHGESQAIAFSNEQHAVDCYNTILNMIAGTGVPCARVQKLTVGASGNIKPDGIAPQEGAELSDEDIDKLANAEIDEDTIADAMRRGLDDD